MDCEGVIITCEDFRLHQRCDGRDYVAQFIKSLGEDCDLITRGGGVKDLAEHCGDEGSVLRDCGISVNLHHAERIYLINHQDCGAYGSFSSPKEEKEKHVEDLEEARNFLSERFPNARIRIYYAELEAGKDDSYLIREVQLAVQEA
jgi:carbonic anhydrase